MTENRHQRWTRIAVKGLFLIVVLVVAGCAGKGGKPALTPIQDLSAPEWVKKGSGAFEDKKSNARFFFGVASASGIRNESLLRTTAENRARTEISKIFQIYTSSLMKDYAASTTAGDPNVTAEEQHVEQAIKTVTAMTLSGSEITDYWQNPATGELFALAKLDLVAFKENLDRAKDLDAAARDYIRKNAETLHEQLEREENELATRNR